MRIHIALVLVAFTVVVGVVCAETAPAAAVELALGINIDPANTEYGNPPASALVTAGASWARVEYKDTAGVGQPPSPKALQMYRDKTAALKAGGVQTLLILDYSSLPGRPAASASNASWVAYSTEFGKRCAAVASFMGDTVAAYERRVEMRQIWNEPDLPTVGNVPAQFYAFLLRSAYHGVKSAGRDATVVMGGLASGDPNYVAAVRLSSGGVVYADKIGLHPYGQRPTANWPTPTWGFGVITTLMDAYYLTEPKDIWITEVGTNVGGTVEGAFPYHTLAAVASFSSKTPSTPRCSHVFWFCYSDGMVNGFGLVNKAGSPKPSYYSFQSYAKSQ